MNFKNEVFPICYEVTKRVPVLKTQTQLDITYTLSTSFESFLDFTNFLKIS